MSDGPPSQSDGAVGASPPAKRPRRNRSKERWSWKDAPTQLRGGLIFLDPDEVILVDDPEAPLYDERVTLPVDPAAVANFRAYGVILPCVGRRDGDKVVILDGKQRVKIAREASAINRACGQPPLRLPVVLRDDDDREALAVAESANAIRWGDSVLAKARKVQRLVTMGYQQKEVARIFGASTSSVSIWLSLLRLDPGLQAMLERGDLRFVDAVRLARLPREHQAAELQQLDEDRRAPKRAPAPSGAGEDTPAAAPSSAAEEAAEEDFADADISAARPFPSPSPAERVPRRHRHKLEELIRFLAEKDSEAVGRADYVLLLWLLDEAPDSALVQAFPRLNRFIAE